MDNRVNEIIKLLSENNDITIIGEHQLILDVLFKYGSNGIYLATGRYDSLDSYLMISKVRDNTIVESLFDKNNDVYECFAKNVVITKDVLEFLVLSKELGKVIDYCEEFKVVF